MSLPAQKFKILWIRKLELPKTNITSKLDCFKNEFAKKRLHFVKFHLVTLSARRCLSRVRPCALPPPPQKRSFSLIAQFEITLLCKVVATWFVVCGSVIGVFRLVCACSFPRKSRSWPPWNVSRGFLSSEWVSVPSKRSQTAAEVSPALV